MSQHAQIAIDGPAGAGKSSVAKRVAEALGYTFVDSGAMYRAVAVAALRRGLGMDDAEAIGELARRARITFGPLHGGRQEVFLDGEDVTDAIRTPEVTGFVSPLSTIPAVREALVAGQRALAAAGPVVMEGRDIQTVVLPDAPVKVFLDASTAERARRRYAELPPGSLTLAEVERSIVDRDTRDGSRSLAPLRAADDATVIDTDGLTLDEVVEAILRLARGGGGVAGRDA